MSDCEKTCSGNCPCAGPQGECGTPGHCGEPGPSPQALWPTNNEAENGAWLASPQAASALTTEIERRILETMQSAFMADPAAMRALTVNRVPCSELLADHPTIVVQEVPVDVHVPSAYRHEVGLIGVLVGIMCDLGCKNVISWSFEPPAEPTNDQQLVFKGFKLVPRS